MTLNPILNPKCLLNRAPTRTFKCFYRVTTVAMIGGSVLVTARQFFGAPIACDAGSVREREKDSS